jgi:hypothetical protein
MRLDKMSHGCDTSDYVALLGPIPVSPRDERNFPVIFLLDGPGGEYDLGKVVEFRGFRKRPPVKCYYWAPGLRVADRPSEFDGYFYGSYFAYLMRKHCLTNVYISNATKCDWIDLQTEKRGRVTAPSVIDNCVEGWLSQEIALFGLEAIFCFGRNAEGIAREAKCVVNLGVIVSGLYHPGAIASRARALRKTKQQLVDENDEIIASELRPYSQRRQ